MRLEKRWQAGCKPWISLLSPQHGNVANARVTKNPFGSGFAGFSVIRFPRIRCGAAIPELWKIPQMARSIRV